MLEEEKIFCTIDEYAELSGFSFYFSAEKTNASVFFFFDADDTTPSGIERFVGLYSETLLSILLNAAYEDFSCVATFFFLL